MTERGEAPPGPRRPFEYAVVTKGRPFTSLVYRAEVRIDEPVTRNDRDVVLIWNYQSPTRFYYAHLSQDNTIYPHNGIFVVNDADRSADRRPVDGDRGGASRDHRHRLARRARGATGRPPAGSRCTSTEPVSR